MQKKPGVATCPWMNSEKMGINEKNRKLCHLPTITGTSASVSNLFIFSTSVTSKNQTYVTHIVRVDKPLYHVCVTYNRQSHEMKN